MGPYFTLFFLHEIFDFFYTLLYIYRPKEIWKWKYSKDRNFEQLCNYVTNTKIEIS